MLAKGRIPLSYNNNTHHEDPHSAIQACFTPRGNYNKGK